jgi:GDP-L-fucose synthase
VILATEKIRSYDPLNIGAGKGFTVDHILQTLLEIEGFSPRVVHDRSKPSTIPMRLVDTARAKKLLGFRPKTTLRDGLKKTVDWYKLNMPKPRRNRT